MRRNPIQFAVVREDPETTLSMIRSTGVERALLIASGGCTALTVQAQFPRLQIVLSDMNQAQLNLVQRKWDALGRPHRSETLAEFNVSSSDPRGLNQCGNFESLFRTLRRFVCEFVAPSEIWKAFLHEGQGNEKDLLKLFENPYWAVAFELAFHNDLLNTMFGVAATQHAIAHSYPRYFRERIEGGLLQSNRGSNYFLSHIFMGHYSDQENSQPPYLHLPRFHCPFELRLSSLQNISDIESYDLVDLSNIMDWMSDEEVKSLRGTLQKMKEGSIIVWRQLNNQKDRISELSSHFRFDAKLGSSLQSNDRSLFYESIHVGFRQ